MFGNVKKSSFKKTLCKTGAIKMTSNDFCFDEQLHHFLKNILEKIINNIDHGFKSQLITLTYLTQPSQILSCNPVI